MLIKTFVNEYGEGIITPDLTHTAKEDAGQDTIVTQRLAHGYLQNTPTLINLEPAWSCTGQGEGSWDLSEIKCEREK